MGDLMERNENVLSLQNLLISDTLSSDAVNGITEMIRREKDKERLVFLYHNYTIGGPFKSKGRTVYRTRAPWMPSKSIQRNSYAALMSALYEHYFEEPQKPQKTKPVDTVKEMFERMLAEYEEQELVSHLTLVHYRSDWKKHIVDTGCEWLNSPIREVKAEQIYAHYRKITAGARLPRATFKNAKTVVNAVFDYAIIHDIPCVRARDIDTRRLKFAPKKDKWEGVYTVSDRKKILDACEQASPTVYTKAIELMFCLDIRIGELRALYKEDVDLERRTIFVGHQMVDVKTDKVNRHSERVDIMKGGQEAGKRTEPLSERAISVIQWLFDAYPDTEWLLPSSGDNTPIRLHRFNDNLKRICKKAGVKYFSSHGIRFHVISSMYDAGISEKEIQRLSGHTTSNMTRYYNRSLGSFEDDKIRKVLG